jgi:DNA-binding CsgD family transcriptional regulator
VKDLLSAIGSSGRCDARFVTVSYVLLALAEVGNGRIRNAERILGGLTTHDPVETIVISFGKEILRGRRVGLVEWSGVLSQLSRLINLQYCDLANLLIAVARHLERAEHTAVSPGVLTDSERTILCQLATGLAPKDIAMETKRSVHTVRVHIANAIVKLGAHGRGEAIQAARRRGLL